VRYAYALTPKGRDLGEVLRAFVHWGKRHIPGTLALNETGTGAANAKSPSASRRARTKRAK
jgi:DNA-binding HxlR family transcriptional regulator